MRLLSILLSVLFVGPLAMAKSLEEKFLDPGVSYVMTGTTAATSAVNYGGQNLLTYKVPAGNQIFYLNYLNISGNFNVISATATTLGTCSLQVPTGTTVATWVFVNPTSSGQTPIVLAPSYPIPTTSTFAISCAPATATAVNWYVSYGGFTY